MNCSKCDTEYNKKDRLGKNGKITNCEDCASEDGDIQKYTGNMIFSHKTAPSLQINKDPKVTQYILGNRDFDSVHKSGACTKEADSFNYKNREN